MDSNLGILDVPTRSEVFKELLRFIYTDELIIENCYDSLAELLMVADEYGLERLKEMCEVELQNGVDIDNAAWILGCLNLLLIDQIRNIRSISSHSIKEMDNVLYSREF